MDLIKNISIIFISIFFESLPFLFFGSLISSIIEAYISNELIAKIIPKNKVFGSIVGVFLGLFIPACDCAVIPVSKRLLKKKVPVNVTVSFMLASPIINPVVLLSTYTAFYQTNPNIFWFRILFGILIALLVGILMGIIFENDNVVVDDLESCECLIDNSTETSCCCKKHKGVKNNILFIFKHTAIDMFEVVKFLMIGALIASLIQVVLPRDILTIFNNNQILSILSLMIFAYLISLCSTSDSFVGKSLLSSFDNISIVAYLLLGPMIDIKNTFVLLGNYKKSFVISLIFFIFIVTFIFSMMGSMYI